MREKKNMANSAKNKGDRGERESVIELVERMPDHAFPDSKRMFGAGRKYDVGDLFVLPDTAVQAKNFKASSLGAAIIESADGAVRQAKNGSLEHALGMVKVPGARKGTVTWLATIDTDHADATEFEPVCDFKMVSKLMTWIRDDEGPYGYRPWPRQIRVAAFSGSRSGSVQLVMPIEAWTEWYVSSHPTLAERDAKTMGNFTHLVAAE